MSFLCITSAPSVFFLIRKYYTESASNLMIDKLEDPVDINCERVIYRGLSSGDFQTGIMPVDTALENCVFRSVLRPTASPPSWI
jgi:hypothetical protein